MYGKLLQKIYFLENAKKTCKPNIRDLNRDWINISILLTILLSILLFQANKKIFHNNSFKNWSFLNKVY